MKTALFFLLFATPVLAQLKFSSDRLPTVEGYAAKQDANQPTLDIFDGFHIGAEYGRRWNYPYDSEYGAYAEFVFNVPAGGVFASAKLIFGNDNMRWRIDMSRRIF